MRAKPTVILLAIGCLTINLTGCQIGKPSLGSLTWWKKNDELASKYVEPPSHQFSPSESAIVSDDPNLPPLPPDIEKTVDSFQQEIDRSYRELAKDSQKANRELIESLEKGTSELLKIAETTPEKTETISTSSNPLTPLASTDSQNLNTEPVADNSTIKPAPISAAKSGSFRPGGGGSFQAATATQTNPGDSTIAPFNEGKSNGFEPSKTTAPNYERLANNTFTPALPDAKTLPNSSEASPSFQVEPKTLPSPTPSNGFVPYAQNPGTPTHIPQLPKGLEPAVTPDYPSTPHKPFESSESQVSTGMNQTDANAKMVDSFNPIGQAATKANSGSFVPPTQNTIPKMKQGSYTPGSISSSGSLDNGELSLPPIPGAQ